MNTRLSKNYCSLVKNPGYQLGTIQLAAAVDSFVSPSSKLLLGQHVKKKKVKLWLCRVKALSWGESGFPFSPVIYLAHVFLSLLGTGSQVKDAAALFAPSSLPTSAFAGGGWTLPNHIQSLLPGKEVNILGLSCKHPRMGSGRSTPQNLLWHTPLLVCIL